MQSARLSWKASLSQAVIGLTCSMALLALLHTDSSAGPMPQQQGATTGASTRKVSQRGNGPTASARPKVTSASTGAASTGAALQQPSGDKLSAGAGEESGAAAEQPLQSIKPYTPEERRELPEVKSDLTRYDKATQDYRSTVDRLVRRAYDRRRGEIIKRYGGKIESEESEERTRRVAAITLFEDFLRRYPKDSRWTPDVIFRLAELYFEKANDEYLVAQNKYEEQLKLSEKGMAAPPVPPRQDYSQTIALHRRLIREWPNYRLVEGAYYLLGFCLSEMGEIETGKIGLLALVCRNQYQPPLEDRPTEESTEPEEGRQRPRLATAREEEKEDSINVNTGMYDQCKPLRENGRFNAEAWTRIGEQHFDENELGPAIAAYKRVLALGPKNNPYYDEALYKLAWTYYRADRYAEAIKQFDRLVTYADKEYERTGKAGSEMRPEAIQYLAISFSEEDWNADGQPDANAGLPRVEEYYRNRKDEKQAYEVYRRLADIYFDTARYAEAIEVYKLALERWPYHADNPDLQDRVIVSLERLRDAEAAMREREEFTKRFGKGTEWEKRNRNNPDALRKAREYDEQALIQAAVHHHKLGQDLRQRGVAMKDVEVLKEAEKEYAIAANAYERYLDRFPNSKNSYEIRYSYASCLFFSERYLEAAKAYGEVRDSNLDNRYQEEAAFSATKAYEAYLRGEIEAKRINEPELPTAKSERNQPMVMPESFRAWQKSLDLYARVLPKSPKTPRLKYKAAELSYRFVHFDDARKRFTSLYDQHCGDPLSVTAGQAILVTYQLEKNLDKMQEWAGKLSSGKCGAGAAAGEVQAGAKKLLVGIEFKRAENLFNEAEKLYGAGKKQEAAPVYDKAAEAYLALVDANPDSEDADKALFNAAVAYEKSMRYESATRIYERVWQRYPQSTLAGDSLWRTAENYKRFFEFKKAVNNYLIMADAPAFKDSEHRTDAIFNAAVILENDQAYGQAAELFLRYADQVQKPQDAADATFRAGLIYEKMGDQRQMTKAFESYKRKFGSQPGQDARVVEALFRSGKQAAKRGSSAEAKDYYRQTIQQYRARGMAPASDASEYAATAEFQLLEPEMNKFLDKKIATTSLSTVVASKKKLLNEATALRTRYDKVLEYKRARWTLAAMYRRGVIFEHVARTVAEGFRQLKVPPNVRRLGQEAIDIYMEQLDQALEREVRPLEEETKKLYALTVEQAERLGVSNEYTEESRRRLNALDPAAYPLLKSPLVEMSMD